MAASLVRSFETSQLPVQEPTTAMPGLEPPAKPPGLELFEAVLRKHIYIAKKRRRILTSVWPVLIYCGITIIMFWAFGDLPTGIRAYLLATLVPLYLGFAFTAVLQTAIVEIVSEKETKMKVLQQIYGLPASIYWASWGAYFSIVALVCIALFFCLLCFAQPVISHANPLLVFIIFAAAYVQQYEFAAIASVFFDDQRTAASFVSFLNLVLQLSAVGAQIWLQGRARALWYLASLLPGINVFNALSAIMWAEGLYACSPEGHCRIGLSIETLFATRFCFQPYSRSRPCPAELEKRLFSAGEVILMTLLDVLLYALLAWWLDNVWQGQYGAAKPLTFCCNPAFMCPQRRGRQSIAPQGSALAAGRSIAMSIRELRKVFKQKVALDGMTLDVYGGEIFALLGHNGAGKTTAINCVVGLIPPTSGTAVVNGFDVATELEAARRQLSICPQDNPLYDMFTVRQHLVFFATLRGVSAARVDARIGEVLSALGMPEKVGDLCTSLSGGQKRRLWVATALIGESPVVFLDEPTSGMDPSSRRELWDLLLGMRATGRSIMFTTHYLEEADVLADRKAILARGKVQAVGTSLDLKRHYGLGYHLHVELEPDAPPDSPARLAAFILSEVPSAREDKIADEERMQASDAACIVNFRLPFADVARLGPLFVSLDARRQWLCVRTYSMAMSSLEEVFMSLGRQAEEHAGNRSNVDFREIGLEEALEGPRSAASDLRSARALARIRLLAIFKDRRALYSACVLPLILNIVGFMVQFGSAGNSSLLGVALYPSMAFGISTISYTMMLIHDRQSKCKYVSLAQGLSVKSYWAGTLVAHYMCSFPLSVFVIVMIIAGKPVGLDGNGLPLICLQAVTYPVGLILFAYNLSLIFTSAEVALKVLPLANLFAGTVPAILVLFLWTLPSPWSEIAKAIHVSMSVANPVYALPGVLLSVGLLSADEDQPHTVADYFTSWCAVPFFGSLVGTAIYGAHLWLQDSRSYRSTPGSLVQFPGTRKGEDVLAEEARVAASEGTGAAARAGGCDDAARYWELHHTYRTKVAGRWVENHAVRGISLGVRRGECFGLLGPNGAGKTTTLSVLTGEVRPPTSGKVTIFGHDMATHGGMVAAYQLLGVCPQVDPLWETITGRQHLLYYGRLAGVPEASLGARVDALLYRLGLEPADANKPAGQYSGGMKRKLSLGIALIGRSPLLFLDEPSAAVDAGAKRHLWKVIKLRARSQTVVITTHSMEEAEALCDRIAIQVKGQLRCLGTPSHIKSMYGSGYQLEVFCQGPAEGSHQHDHHAQLQAFMLKRLSPQIRLLEQHAGRYLFQLPPIGTGTGSLTLGKVFTELQGNMGELGITDYSLAQPSLEQVFIRFAKEQDEQEPEPDTQAGP